MRGQWEAASFINKNILYLGGNTQFEEAILSSSTTLQGYKDWESMDRKWIFANHLSKEYEDGLKEFIKYAIDHAKNSSRITCPCLKCCHARVVRVDELEDHFCVMELNKVIYVGYGTLRQEMNLLIWEIMKGMYVINDINTNICDDDCLEKITNVVEEDLQDCPKMFTRLVSDAKKSLYNGCTKFIKLSMILKLYNLKESMSYERIRDCPNDYILFRNEYAWLDMCPKCNVLQYKRKESTPAKVLWNFPTISRFRHMYHSVEDAKHLIWNSNEKN
ncbi:hypothetical protein CR513_45903, partial [Mucuna pruriens]